MTSRQLLPGTRGELVIPTTRIPDVSSRPEPRGARRGWSVVGRRHGRAWMTIAITRREPGAGDLRREAARCRDARAARRMLALALVLEGSGPPPEEWRGGIRTSRGRAHVDPFHAGPRLGRGAVAQGRVQTLPVVEDLI